MKTLILRSGCTLRSDQRTSEPREIFLTFKIETAPACHYFTTI